MDLEFANLTAFNWLWVIAGLVGLAVFAISRRRRAMSRFADAILVARIAPGFSVARPALRAALMLAALVAIVIALGDPRWGVEQVETRRQGADIMFVVDVSRSMLAQDATPNRLDRAKQFVADALESMGGDRVGLVDFAGVPALRVPLTLNHGAMRTALNELQPKASMRGGSMLGDAIRLASQSFIGDANVGRAIVVLTDGEDMESSPVEEARTAFKDTGTLIFTVGLGDDRDGARIPVLGPQGQTFLTHDGEEVWSKMDPATLAETAAAGGGLFIPAGTAQIDLGAILEGALADLQRGDFESSAVQRTIPRYQWPVAVALLLLLVECMLRDRKARALEGELA